MNQIHTDQLIEEEFDIIICASGYERRATHFLNVLKYSQVTNAKKICFAFKDRIELSRERNDIIFKKRGFSFIEIASNKIEYFSIKFHELFKVIRKKRIKIFFDYSCMTSIMYAAILKYFKDFCDLFEQASIMFSYTQANYTKPQKNNSIYLNYPIPLFNPIQATDKKIALIMGLGYEENKALGLYEYFQNDKDDIYLFITGGSSQEFYKEVKKNNQKLLNITNEQNVLYYDLDNISHLISTLDSLANYLISTDYRVVIAPIGPKVFTLCSMLVNLNHKEITTYRLSDGEKGKSMDKEANVDKELIITQLNLIHEEILVQKAVC